MGVPILISLPEGEATEIVRRTGSGVCVPPEDAAALAQAISRLADAPDQMERLRSQAHAAAPGFSRDRLAEGLCSILAGLVSGRSGGQAERNRMQASPGKDSA